MVGVTRILAGLNNKSAVFSSGTTVPRNNPYFSAYLEESIKKVKAVRDLYKTLEVDVAKKQYVNLGLRAATWALLKEADKKDNCLVALVTFHLSDDYVEFLKGVDEKCGKSTSSLKRPIAHIREDLTNKIVKPMGIEHEFFVLEPSDGGGIHVHMLCCLVFTEVKSTSTIDVKNTVTYKRLMDTIRRQQFIKAYRSSVQVKVAYHQELYRAYLDESPDGLNAELIEHEIKTLGLQSTFVVGKTFFNSDGDRVVASYKSRNPVPIDTGIADYLAKSLVKPVFRTSRDNYSINLKVRKKLRSIADEIISANKKR